MSTHLATTTLTLLRGDATDALGDATDVNTAVAGASSIPAGLTERERLVLDPASGEPRTITQYNARLVPGTFPAVKGDRVRDETTGDLYVVESVKSQPRTIGGLSTLRLILSKTTG